MNLRIEIDDDLYNRYKAAVKDSMLQITKLNQSLMEKAIRDWLKENIK